MASVFNLSRVFRFGDKGVPQITKFPEDDPEGATDLEIRIKHFTEIENFTFLGYVLAHELSLAKAGFGQATRISTLQDLVVSDSEFQQLIDKAKAEKVTN